MLTISSIAVAPTPQATPPVARAQPVAAVRPSQTVSQDDKGSATAPQGEVARVQARFAPSPLAPVPPTQESQRADALLNAAAPERSGLPPPPSEGVAMGRGQTDGVAAEYQEANQRIRQEADSPEGGTAIPGRDVVRGQTRSESASPIEERSEALQTDKPANPVDEAIEEQIRDLLPNMWKASRAAVDMMIGEEARKAAEERSKRLDDIRARILAKPLAAVPAEGAAQTYFETASNPRPPVVGARLDRLV